MSDLNAMIERWRDRLGELSAAQADELEDHLRSETESLTSKGLSEREAFTVATMRCGRPDQLEYEFACADPAVAWGSRLRWMLVGVIACGAFNLVLSAANQLVGVALVKGGTSLPVAIALRVGSLSVAIFLVIAAWHMWLARRGGALPARSPAWLTAGWTLAAMIVVLPWLAAAWNLVQTLAFARMLSSHQLGELALSTSVASLLLPFAGPLVLFIIAVGLSKQRRAAAEA